MTCILSWPSKTSFELVLQGPLARQRHQLFYEVSRIEPCFHAYSLSNERLSDSTITGFGHFGRVQIFSNAIYTVPCIFTNKINNI